MAIAMVLHAIVSAVEHVGSTQGAWPKAKLAALLTYMFVKELMGIAVVLPSVSRSVLLYSSLPPHPKSQMQSIPVIYSKRKGIRLPRSHLHWASVFHVSVARNIPYGRAKRNLLDVYVPDAAASEGGRQKLPAVMFVHGGAWASGGKEMFSHLGACLAHSGILTVLVQYTLFPEVLAWEQVREVSRAFTWFLDNVEHYGGDVESVTLMGHSAGAHLCALVVWERFKAAKQLQQRWQAAAEACSLVPEHEPEIDEEDLDEQDLRQPCNFIGLAGVYDIVEHLKYERKRGVDMLSSMTPAMGGKHLLEAMSPVHLFRSFQAGESIVDAGAKHDVMMPVNINDADLDNMSNLGAVDAGLCAAGTGSDEVHRGDSTDFAADGVGDVGVCAEVKVGDGTACSNQLPRCTLLASWGDSVVRPDSSISFCEVLQEQLGHHSELIMFNNLVHSDFVNLDGRTLEQVLLRKHILQILQQ